MMQDMDYKEARAELAKRIDAMGLTIESAFVPFSQSRSKGEKMPNLNWRVTLKKGERAIVTCDYSAGQAHCPAYQRERDMPGYWDDKGKKWARDRMIAIECETGFRAKHSTYMQGSPMRKFPILPDSVDVISSLCMDSSVLDHATYESWASEFGYDPDSRKGETIYRECLAHALALRAAIGDAELSELSELSQML